MKKTGVTLIGMPGAGKSTVGVLLAKRLVKRFIDSDLAIQQHIERGLQDLVDTEGYQVLRAIEEKVLLALDAQGSVLATGGSAVYSERAMRHLRGESILVYLEISYAVVEARIGDFSRRGIAKSSNQSLAEAFEERCRLYRRWSEMTVDATLPVEEVVSQICKRIAAGIS